jgi:hypothetical protein
MHVWIQIVEVDIVLFLFSQISDCELTLKEICFIVFPEIFIENLETHLFKSTYLSFL